MVSSSPQSPAFQFSIQDLINCDIILTSLFLFPMCAMCAVEDKHRSF